MDLDAAHNSSYLIEHLSRLSALNNMPSSVLITTDNLERASLELESFIQQNFDIDLRNYSQNAASIKPEETGNINIDQIRKLKALLNNTASNGYKIALIAPADAMNISCANACLKLLEESAQNTYIFLITVNSAKILATIKSRCYKISAFYRHTQQDDKYYEQILHALSNNNALDILQNSEFKTRWEDLAQSFLLLSSRMIKYHLNCQLNYSDAEKLLFSHIKCQIDDLINCFDHIERIFFEAKKYDLEPRSIIIIIFNLIISKIKV